MTTAMLELRCPRCNRFLGEITPPARVVCCGLSIEVAPNERRPAGGDVSGARRIVVKGAGT